MDCVLCLGSWHWITFLPPANEVFTSVCLSTGGGGGVCLSACWDSRPPRSRRPPPEQTPPCAVHAGRYAQQAGRTHPTGMHTCLDNVSFFTLLQKPCPAISIFTWLNTGVVIYFICNTRKDSSRMHAARFSGWGASNPPVGRLFGGRSPVNRQTRVKTLPCPKLCLRAVIS